MHENFVQYIAEDKFIEISSNILQEYGIDEDDSQIFIVKLLENLLIDAIQSYTEANFDKNLLLKLLVIFKFEKYPKCLEMLKNHLNVEEIVKLSCSSLTLTRTILQFLMSIGCKPSSIFQIISQNHLMEPDFASRLIFEILTNSEVK